MIFHRVALLTLALVLVVPSAAPQTMMAPVAASAQTAVPALVPFSGTALAADGKPLPGDATATFLIFKDETGGEALFTESQTVVVDATGHYKVQLGASNPNGLPADLFSSGEARWLEIQIAGKTPEARLLLASVPYALKAADAATLGGLPASAFMLAGEKTTYGTTSPDANPSATDVTTTGGITGYVPAFSAATAIVDSPIFVSGSNVGIGLTAPTVPFEVTGSTVLNGTMTVNGSSTYNGGLTLPPPGTATSSKGYNSQFLKVETSAWNSSTASAVSPRFEWVGEISGNNTATPTATLNLQSSTTTAAPTETGFHFNANGTINFAPGQTFPGGGGGGSGTITGVTAGTDLKGGGTSGTVTLNLDTTKIPTLAATNTFAQGANFGGSVTATAVGAALVGTSSSGYGVFGSSTAPTEGGAGVFGETGEGSLVYGSVDGNHVAGVWGDTTGNPSSGNYAAGVIGTADDANGGAFYNNSPSNPAVFAQNNSTTEEGGDPVAVEGIVNGYGIGVLGYGDQFGVEGSGNAGVAGFSGSEKGDGVYGASTGSLGSGVNGVFYAASNEGGSINFDSGVWADTDVASEAAFLATADEGYGGLFYNDGSAYATIYAENDAASSSGALVFHTSGGHFGGNCKIDVSGNLSCSGQIANVASVDNGAHKVETYSMQSAENWLEDFGTGQLAGGVAHVDLEPIFGQTVNTGIEYHVFLTPNGDCKGLYVSTKSAGGFEVRELGSGKSSVAFDYRIVAKRSGYETARLVDVTDQIKEEAEVRGRTPHPAIARPQIPPAIRIPARPGVPASRRPQMGTPLAPTQPTVSTPPAKKAE